MIKLALDTNRNNGLSDVTKVVLLVSITKIIFHQLELQYTNYNFPMN